MQAMPAKKTERPTNGKMLKTSPGLPAEQVSVEVQGWSDPRILDLVEPVRNEVRLLGQALDTAVERNRQLGELLRKAKKLCGMVNGRGSLPNAVFRNATLRNPCSLPRAGTRSRSTKTPHPGGI